MGSYEKLSAHGTMELKLGLRGAFRKITVTAGPFDAFDNAPNSFGLAVRAERINPSDCDVHLPIRDFSVPDDPERVRKALTQVFNAALAGKNVYVGCMGGYGRTGLFLALMAKAAGVANPVGFVRETYNSKAVETKAQEKYVDTLNVDAVRAQLYANAWRSRIPFLRKSI